MKEEMSSPEQKKEKDLDMAYAKWLVLSMQSMGMATPEQVADALKAIIKESKLP